MGKRSQQQPPPAPDPGPVDEGPDGPDFSLVLPLSLLAGGLAAYPSLSEAADGQGDFMGAVTLFLVATLVATFGFAIVAYLFHSYSGGDAAGDEAGDSGEDPATDRSLVPYDPREQSDGPVPTVALTPPPDPHADAIDTALAPTDTLVHDAN